jgi:hypothetical protein
VSRWPTRRTRVKPALETLETKKGLFDAYARRSDTAEAMPEALEIAGPALARQVIDAERERLGLAR